MSADHSPHIQTLLSSLPNKPGVYQMFNKAGTIIYVGKAKNLKRRVSSYFNRVHANSRTWSMVKRVEHFDIILTETEAEALLLESNLIKKHSPKYNVLLRDDKSYPYIRLSDHRFPRLSFYRGNKAVKGKLFGPYTNSAAVREALQLLQKLFKVRQCKDSEYSHRSRPCLQHQINRCQAPCVDLVSEQEYQLKCQLSEDFLQGKNQQVIEQLIEVMEQQSASLEFEQAADTRDTIEQLRSIAQQQLISFGAGDYDIISLYTEQSVICVHITTVRNGNQLGSRNYFPKAQDNLSSDEVLTSFIAQYYLNKTPPKEIICNRDLTGDTPLQTMLTGLAGHTVEFKYRVIGLRKKLLQHAERNARHALNQQIIKSVNMKHRFDDLAQQLKLDEAPERIECFDISHSSGESTVASCVVFGQNGAIKDDYRRFNIDGITAGDDYAAMQQAITRRLKHNTPLPDMLLIDGGKGQLNAALAVIPEDIAETMHILGVTKGEGRKQENDKLTLNHKQVFLPPDCMALHLIQQVRDEAHRFAITGHRNARDKTRKTSSLEQIEGLGPKRRRQLILYFGGQQAIQRASIEEIAKVPSISENLAKKIYNHLHA